MKSISKNEYIIENYFQNNFHTMFQPIFWIQKAYFGLKFSYSDNFISPNSQTYLIKSFLVHLIYLCLQIVFSYYLVSGVCVFPPPVCLISNLHATCFMLIIIISYITIYTKSESYVKIIITLQQINNNQGFLTKNNSRKYAVYVWTSIIVIIVTSAGSFITELYWLEYTLKLNIVYIVAQAFVDVEMIHCILYYTIFQECLNTFIRKIEKFSGTNVELNKLYNDFKVFLEGYRLLKDVFKMTVVLYVVKFIVDSLMYVQMTIVIILIEIASQDKNISITTHPSTVRSCVWVAKLILILCALCRKCELFDNSMDKFRSVLIQKKGYDYEHEGGSNRHLYKNFIRLTTTKYEKFLAYKAFYVDNKLPLTIVSLVATHVVVLLQIVFFSWNKVLAVRLPRPERVAGSDVKR